MHPNRLTWGLTTFALALLTLGAAQLGMPWTTDADARDRTPALWVQPLQTDVIRSAAQWAKVEVTVDEPTTVTLAIGRSGVDIMTVTERVQDRWVFEWRGTAADGRMAGRGLWELVVSGAGQAHVVSLYVTGKPGPSGGRTPPPPTGLAVVATTENTLTWDRTTDIQVTSYAVYRSTSPTDGFERLGGTAVGLETRTDAPASRGIYWYRVTAVGKQKNRESQPSGAVSSDNVHLTQVVGAGGGTIEPTTGTVRLEIPPGAVTNDTSFTIDQLDAPPPPATNLISVSRSFEIGPHGTSFATPAILTLRYEVSAEHPLPRNFPRDTTWVQYWTGSEWSSLPGATVDTVTSTVTVPLSHLSTLGANGISVPHGGYTSQTSLCGFCHKSHEAPGPNLHPYNSERETCYQCHNSGQGAKVNEIQQIALIGTWVPGETFKLWFDGETTGTITAGATSSATATNISDALLDLPNIDGSSALPNPEPGVDGVSVTGTGPFTVTFQNGQGTTDVRELMSTEIVSVAGNISITTVAQGTGVYVGALTDILGAFGETWPVNGTSTRASFHPVPGPRDGFQLSCSDCHTPHRDPAEYTALLRRPDGSGGYIYSPVAGPAIGNQFCTLKCHDSTSTYPAPFGDHTAFQGSAHDVANVPTANEVQRVAVDATGGTFKLIFAGDITAALAYNITAANLQTALVGLTSIGAGNVLVTGGPGGAGAVNPYVVTFQAAKAAKDVPAMVSDRTLLTGGASTAVVTTTINGRAAQPSGDVRCLSCHDPHASDNRRLTDASQETLCLSCHTAGTPNTSGGTNPPWTAATGPFAGSNVYNAFNAATNNYTAGSVRIYHHPISNTDQAGGARQVECESCHNSHLSDRTDGAILSKAANPTNVFAKWIFGWDFASGYMSRGTNVNQFCLNCHVNGSTTAPLNAGATIPYNVRMVNDGSGHELFNAATWPDSNHAYADTPATYNSCDARGVSNTNCVVTCTNCHDPHGSTNAFVLREKIIPPDYVTFTVTNASWAAAQGGVATLEYRTPSGLACTASVKTGCTVGKGVTITVTGVTWSGYNGLSFVTTNSAVGSQAGPITYALTDPIGSGPTGGTVAPPTSYTMTGWDGSSASIRAWCLACHIERGTDHKSGACTDCHDHTIAGIGAATQL